MKDSTKKFLKEKVAPIAICVGEAMLFSILGYAIGYRRGTDNGGRICDTFIRDIYADGHSRDAEVNGVVVNFKDDGKLYFSPGVISDRTTE